MSVEREPTDEGQRELDIRVGLGVFASDQQLEHLLSISRQVDIEAGQVLYRYGEPTQHVFQVMSGNVELRAPAGPLWTIDDAGTAGLLDLMLGRPHARTAVATSAVRALELDAADYRDYLEDNFDVAHRILGQMSSDLCARSVASSEAERVFTRTEAVRAGQSFAKVEIPVIDRMMMLLQMPVFGHASTQALATLGQTSNEMRYAPGEVIASAGDRSSVISALVEGTVELALPGGQHARRTGRALLAHVEELADGPRLATVTAITPVIALQLEREELLDRLEEHFDLTLSLFRFLAQCQEQMNDLLVAAGLPLGFSWR